MKKNKVILTILDGYGIGEQNEYNAVTNASTPNLDKLFKKYPSCELVCSGAEVGLPEGTMGNSEVGHLNIGAGRIVYQDISRIDRSIEDGSFFENPALNGLIDYAKKNGKKLHLLGLLSDGGVHSSLNHLEAILKKCKQESFDNLFVHAFTDGRDTAPDSGMGFVEKLERKLTEYTGKIASVSGRFYAMDRDKRWNRVQKAYDVLVSGKGDTGNSALEIMKKSYDRDVTDEFIIPANVVEDGKPVALIEEGDAVLFFNYRSDRARELSIVLNDTEFNDFPTKKLDLLYKTMTSYREDFEYEILFPKSKYENLLGKVVADNGLSQLRIAETEKFAHITFFFNGGFDKPFENEDRILVDSPKVETYDLQPEMSAYEVTEKLVKALKEDKYGLIILNLANCDMVGHTGIYEAAVKAVEAVDECVGNIYETAMANGYDMILTADHGNSEKMMENGRVFTAHTKNVVPLLVTKEDVKLKNGKLADIAPTILNLLKIEIPSEMTGDVLIK